MKDAAMADRASRADARRTRLSEGFDPPGPRSCGERTLKPAEDETLDALAGDWRLFQRADGHRYSADDLLIAHYAGAAASDRGLDVSRVLDLGCGIGSVLLLMAWQFPKATVHGVEAQTQSAALARRSIAYNGIGERASVVDGDLRTHAPVTRDYELVTGSPPYFDVSEGRVSSLPQRGPCRFELRGDVSDYLAAMALALAPGGLAALVMATAGRARVLAGAAAAGLGVISYRPVVFREDREPRIDLFAFEHGSRPAPEPQEELVLRLKDGSRSTEFRQLRLSMGFPPLAA